MAEIDDRLDKIRKILAMAEAKGTTSEEAEAFADKAAALIAKWGISDALLASAGKDERRETIDYTRYVPSAPKTYHHEYIVMGANIARVFGVTGIIVQDWDGLKLGLVGFESDVERVLMLWASLQVQCITALLKARKNVLMWNHMTGMNRYKWNRSFIAGFGNEVTSRLKMIYKKAVEDSGGDSTALVLKSREVQVKGWLEENLNLRDTKGRRYGHGFGDGQKAGENAVLGQADLKGSHKMQHSIGG